MVNPWLLLELEPTPDKKIIRRSYTRLLKKYHPEDDPEGFLQLRAAYDEALRLSVDVVPDPSEAFPSFQSDRELPRGNSTSVEGEASLFSVHTLLEEEEQNGPHQQSVRTTIILNEEEGTDNPYFNSFSTIRDEVVLGQNGLELLHEQLHELYADVFRRRDIVAWRTLFVGRPLEDDGGYEEKVRHFFAENAHLPHDVWQYLDEEFDLMQMENFPWKHLIQWDYGLSFDWLSSEIDVDYNSYAAGRFEAFLSLQQGMYEDCIDIAQKAAGIYDQDPVLDRLIAEAYYRLAKYLEACGYFSRVLHHIPDDRDALKYEIFARQWLGPVADFTTFHGISTSETNLLKDRLVRGADDWLFQSPKMPKYPIVAYVKHNFKTLFRMGLDIFIGSFLTGVIVKYGFLGFPTLMMFPVILFCVVHCIYLCHELER